MTSRDYIASSGLTIAALSALAIVYWAFRDLQPFANGGDPTKIQAADLAELSLKSVSYVQTLTTAVFGGAVLVLSQRFLGRGFVTIDRKRRVLVAFGFLMLGMSLLVGFINIEVLIEAADQRVIDSKMHDMRNLRVLQSAYLLIGVAAIGGIVVADVIRGRGHLKQ